MAAVLEYGLDSEVDPGNISRWAVAVHLLKRAHDVFQGDGQAVELRQITRELKIDELILREVAEGLRDAGVLAELEGPKYVLARDPSTIELATLDSLFDTAAIPSACDPAVKEALGRVGEERLGSWRHKTLADLLALG